MASAERLITLADDLYLCADTEPHLPRLACILLRRMGWVLDRVARWSSQ